jgi:hypothetical protein
MGKSTPRAILKRILNGEKETVKSLDYLLGAGFHFGVNTHTIKKGEKQFLKDCFIFLKNASKVGLLAKVS